MTKIDFRKILFQDLKNLCSDNDDIEGQTIVELVECYGIEPLTDSAKTEWLNLMEVLGIEIKF